VDIRLRPLDEGEFPALLEQLREEYVRSMVEEAGLSQADAEDKARADHESLFPDGAPQAHHRIYVLEDAESGERRGHIFWAARQPPGSSTKRAYLYELFIDESFRGRGLGRRALELVEADARAAGLPAVDLNVWGGNEAARALYRTAGYSERAVFMSKELA
jgi:ribosomal protein S18 acetylase RimI-like enzyme